MINACACNDFLNWSSTSTPWVAGGAPSDDGDEYGARFPRACCNEPSRHGSPSDGPWYASGCWTAGRAWWWNASSVWRARCGVGTGWTGQPCHDGRHAARRESKCARDATSDSCPAANVPAATATAANAGSVYVFLWPPRDRCRAFPILSRYCTDTNVICD